MPETCPSCKHSNSPGAAQCENCGAPLVGNCGLAQWAGQIASLYEPGQLDRLSQAAENSQGQKRDITVLCAGLIGCEQLRAQLDLEEFNQISFRLVKLLTSAILKFDGTVDAIQEDHLIALFGAPLAYQTQANLAARAALEMQANFTRFTQDINSLFSTTPQLQIGLHSGTILFQGSIPGILLRSQEGQNIIEQAQVLEEATRPGMILVSETVYNLTKEHFHYKEQAIDLISESGLPEHAFALEEIKILPGTERGVHGLRAPMVGREAELNQLAQSCRWLVEHNRSGFFLISGEAGIGKSRLVSELKSRIAALPLNLIEGQSLPDQQAHSYWPFIDLIRRATGIQAEANEAASREKFIRRIDSLMGDQSIEVRPYLQHLLSIETTDQETEKRLRYLDPEQLRQQIFLAVRDYMLAEARQKPTLVVLEDLHWADIGSLELLHFLIGFLSEAPILLVGTSRTLEYTPIHKLAEKARQTKTTDFVHLYLDSLSLDQSEQLLLRLLSLPDLPENIRRQILQRAAGNPFYLEEILRTLIDKGIVRRKAGHWELSPDADVAALGVPTNLQELILSRFDHLDRSLRRILQIASVIGNQFDFTLLKMVLKLSTSELQDEFSLLVSFSMLIDRAFIISLTGSLKAEFAFRHILVLEAIYDTLSSAERSQLHGIVAESILQIYSSRLEEKVELLANHFSRSNFQKEALHYLILAGQKSAHKYANQQARQFFEQALQLLPIVDHSVEQAIHVHMGLGEVMIFTGEYADARHQFQEAIDIIGDKYPQQYAVENCMLYRKLSSLSERQGDYDSALAYLEKAQKALLLAGTADHIATSQIMNDVGWINFRLGNRKEAENDLLHALSLVEDSSAYDVIASIYNRLGGLYYQKARFELASEYVHKSILLREQIGDIVATARSYNNLGLLTWLNNNWNQALMNFSRSVALLSKLGDVEATYPLHNNIGLLLIDLGQLSEARQHLEISLKGAEQHGHHFTLGMAYHHLSRLELGAKNWHQALEYSAKALEIFKQMGVKDRMILVDIYASMGEAWLGMNDPGQAMLAAKEAQEILVSDTTRSQAPLPERGRLWRLLGNIALLQNQIDTAKMMLNESIFQYRELNNQLEFARCLLALARLAHLRGEPHVHYLNEARTIFTRLGAKLDVQSVDYVEALIG